MVEYIFCSCGKVIDEYESKCFWCGNKKKEKPFENLNETLSKEEFDKMIAETMWMADRPRTWWEWFSYNFWGT